VRIAGAPTDAATTIATAHKIELARNWLRFISLCNSEWMWSPAQAALKGLTRQKISDGWRERARLRGLAIAKPILLNPSLRYETTVGDQVAQIRKEISQTGESYVSCEELRVLRR
jgi:hypothetical protein